MVVNEYFIIKNGKKKGPLSFHEILCENLTDPDLIYFEGLDDYTCLWRLPELKTSIISALPYEIPDLIDNNSKPKYLDYIIDVNPIPLFDIQNGKKKLERPLEKSAPELSKSKNLEKTWADGCLSLVFRIILVIAVICAIHFIVENMAKGILSNDPVP